MHNFIYIGFWLVFTYLAYRNAQKRGLWMWRLFLIGLGIFGALIGAAMIVIFYTNLPTEYPNGFLICMVTASALVVAAFLYSFRNYGVKKVPPAEAAQPGKE